jgi:hypothetical protein
MRLIDWLNRVLVVLLLVLLLAASLAIALLPGVVAGWLRDTADLLIQPAFSGGWLAVFGGSLVVAVIALVLLVLELRVRRGQTVALAGDPTSRLATDTLVQRLRSDVEAIPEIDQARPQIYPRRRSVDVDLLVTTAPNVDVPSKAAQVGEVARATIESLGLKPGKVSVQLRHTSRAWPGRGGSPPPADSTATSS